MTNQTKYAEMCAAANASTRSFREYRDRCLHYIDAWINQFWAYCSIPEDGIVLLKWNGKRGNEAEWAVPEENRRHTLPGALVYDEEEDLWNVGIRLSLGQTNWVFLLLYVGERDGKAVIKLWQDAALQPLEVNDPVAMHKLFDLIIERVKTLYSEPHDAGGRSIGFRS